MYLERLSSDGIDTSPYYVPNGKFNTAPPNSDIQMPNCTMYCYCRGFEASDATKPFYLARNGYGFGNAKEWYSQSPLPKGSSLKDGSIAVFDGQYGHVCFVERVIDSNHALITESQYDSNKQLRNYKYWQKRIVELEVGKATLSGVGKLLGFLYLPIDEIRTSRDSNKEQIEIVEEMVNVRATPNGYVARKGCFAPLGIYNVLSKQEVDGYTWYQLDKDNWVREGDWLNYYPANDYEALLKENEELKKKLKQINVLSEVNNG